MIIKTKGSLLPLFVSLILSTAIVSCSTEGVISEENTQNASFSRIKINTRAANEGMELYYPLSVYFYPNADGDPKSVIINQSNVDEQGQAEVSLPYGVYSAHAFSGTRDFAQGYAATPLYYGSETLKVESSEENLSVTLKAAVAEVSVKIYNIPSSVDAVSLTLGPQYAAMADNGAMSGAVQAKVKCAKTATEGEWTTGVFYVLPGTSTSTIINVDLTTGTETESYSIGIGEGLKANTQYEFPLSFKDPEEESGTVKVHFGVGDWDGKVTIGFGFGPGSVGTGDLPVLYVDDYPTDIDKINDYVVIPYDDSHLALLFSRQGWDVTAGEDISAIPGVATYSEGALTDWKVPTTKEAGFLIEKCSGGVQVNKLQRKLEQSLDEKDKFLCNEGHSYYTLGKQARILPAEAGEKYKLRLVRTVQLQKR